MSSPVSITAPLIPAAVIGQDGGALGQGAIVAGGSDGMLGVFDALLESVAEAQPGLAQPSAGLIAMKPEAQASDPVASLAQPGSAKVLPALDPAAIVLLKGAGFPPAGNDAGLVDPALEPPAEPAAADGEAIPDASLVLAGAALGVTPPTPKVDLSAAPEPAEPATPRPQAPPVPAAEPSLLARSGSETQRGSLPAAVAPEPATPQSAQPSIQASNPSIAPPPAAAQVAAAQAVFQSAPAKPVQTEPSPSSKTRTETDLGPALKAGPASAERAAATGPQVVPATSKGESADRPDIAALQAEAGAAVEAQPSGAEEASGPDQTPAATAAILTSRTADSEAPRATPQTVAHPTAQIVKKLDGRSSRFDLQLDPLGLGNVDVRIEIKPDGKMTAAMSFDTPQAAAELRARAGELQAAMEKAGFDLSGGMSFDVAGERGQGRHMANQEADPGFRGRAFQAALDVAGEAGDGALAAALNMRSSARSGVDVRI